MKAAREVGLAFASGALFGAGLIVGGMTQPGRVVGFLNFFGEWDPTLVFVMASALLVYGTLYRVITKRRAPVFVREFLVPDRKDINVALFAGSALFGVGWGLAGYCPGPGITSLATAGAKPIAFVVAMVAGFVGKYLWDTRKSSRTDKVIGAAT